MCMKKFNDETIIFDKLTTSTSHIEVVHTLCNQLLLQHLVYPFNTLQVCYRHIEDVHEEVY